MLILCIKSVMMFASGEKVFSEGKTYKAVVTKYGIETINDNGQDHHLLLINDRHEAAWDWFAEHFS